MISSGRIALGACALLLLGLPARAQQMGSDLDEIRVAVDRPVARPASPGSLLIQTVREYGCSGFRIRSSYRQHGDTLRLTLMGIEAPFGDGCPTMIAPAATGVPLPTEPGVYTLIVEHGTRRSVFRLTILAEYVEIRLLSRTSTAADTLIFRRLRP